MLVRLQNISYENELDLQEIEPVVQTHFQKNGLKRKLVLSQRQKATR